MMKNIHPRVTDFQIWFSFKIKIEKLSIKFF